MVGKSQMPNDRETPRDSLYRRAANLDDRDASKQRSMDSIADTLERILAVQREQLSVLHSILESVSSSGAGSLVLTLGKPESQQP
jgi:hypothetical protein